jgi:DnaJ-domain-containing protein 1
LNGDLLVECLASVLKKQVEGTFVEKVFTLLTSAEFGWDENERGTKPSVYLSELLHQIPVTAETAAAYITLGVKMSDDSGAIRRTYRMLAATYHPDSVQELSVEQQKLATEAFLRIQQAYMVICKSRGES